MQHIKSLQLGLLVFAILTLLYSYISTINTICLDKFTNTLSLFSICYEAILIYIEK